MRRYVRPTVTPPSGLRSALGAEAGQGDAVLGRAEGGGCLHGHAPRRSDEGAARPAGDAGVDVARRLESASVSIDFELLPNAVWRFGRVFLRCPECGRRATRIYIPTENLPLGAADAGG